MKLRRDEQTGLAFVDELTQRELEAIVEGYRLAMHANLVARGCDGREAFRILELCEHAILETRFG